jgi:hypothetical protein
LPLQQNDQGFTRTASAFEALLKIEKAGDFSAGNGLSGLAALLELVEACAATVVSQIENLKGNAKKWDPIAGAVELLLIGSALGGSLLASQAQTDEGLLEALFKDMPAESPSTTTDMKAIYNLLRSKRGTLQDLLRAHISVAKGGRAGRFINPVIPLAAARLLRRRNWELDRKPEALSEPYKPVGDLYAAIQTRLAPALAIEQAERSTWVDRVEQAFGAQADKQAILARVQMALDAAATGGLPGPRSALEAAKADFGGVQYVAALEGGRQIKNANPPLSVLPNFARASRNAVEASEALIDKWSSFLDIAEVEIKARRSDNASAGVESESNRLKAALAELIDELSDLEGQEATHEPA